MLFILLIGFVVVSRLMNNMMEMMDEKMVESTTMVSNFVKKMITV